MENNYKEYLQKIKTESDNVYFDKEIFEQNVEIYFRNKEKTEKVINELTTKLCKQRTAKGRQKYDNQIKECEKMFEECKNKFSLLVCDTLGYKYGIKYLYAKEIKNYKELCEFFGEETIAIALKEEIQAMEEEQNRILKDIEANKEKLEVLYIEKCLLNPFQGLFSDDKSVKRQLNNFICNMYIKQKDGLISPEELNKLDREEIAYEFRKVAHYEGGADRETDCWILGDYIDTVIPKLYAKCYHKLNSIYYVYVNASDFGLEYKTFNINKCIMGMYLDLYADKLPESIKKFLSTVEQNYLTHGKTMP